MVKTSAFYYYYRIVIETQNSKAKGLCFIPVEQQMLRNIKSTVSDFFCSYQQQISGPTFQCFMLFKVNFNKWLQHCIIRSFPSAVLFSKTKCVKTFLKILDFVSFLSKKKRFLADFIQIY